MANEIRLNTRLLLRYDTLANWNNNNPVLMAGEVAVATIPSTDSAHPIAGSVSLPQAILKVGDGTSTYTALPFASALAADVHSWAKLSWNDFVTEINKLSFVSSDALAETLKGYYTKAEADAAIKVVSDALSAYKTTNDAAVQAAANAASAADGKAVAAQGDVDALETYVGTFTASEGVDTVVKYIDAKTANIATDADVEALEGRVGAIETSLAEGGATAQAIAAAQAAGDAAQTYAEGVATDLSEYETANDAALAEVRATADAAAVKTEVDTALAGKADKATVDAMYTNVQIDGFIADAKKYADDNDANTTYTIGYESKTEEHNARIVLTPSEGEVQYVDATPFIKDGMLESVAYNADTNTLTFTFNTDAGKEAVSVVLTDILAPYTGSTGARVNVTVADGVISADLVEGSIAKSYLDTAVQASLDLANSALQEHQDISNLATKAEVDAVDDKFADYTTTNDLNTALELKADKTQVAEDIAAAKTAAINAAAGDAASKDTAILAEAQGYTDSKVAAINNETTGILAQAKSYADGLNTAMDTRVGALETTVGNADGGLVKTVAAHDGILAGIGGVDQPATVLDAIEAAAYELPAASDAALGGLKTDANFKATEGVVTGVSTDLLFNGVNEIILVGGTSKTGTTA